MSDLEIRNDTINTIQVKFNDASSFMDIKPGGARVNSVPGTYLVARSQTEVFDGGFSGISNVKIAPEETTANPEFVAKNSSDKVVVVAYGSATFPLQLGQSKSFTDPGKYNLSFQNALGGAIVSINFPSDVTNVTVTIR
ncbi:hypothetical protein AX15_005093 [Amanita polypyramis BW_CC]|nr:hypothetical protein AX15_005093 [Amanita polypyramis BW_CC]